MYSRYSFQGYSCTCNAYVAQKVREKYHKIILTVGSHTYCMSAYTHLLLCQHTLICVLCQYMYTHLLLCQYTLCTMSTYTHVLLPSMSIYSYMCTMSAYTQCVYLHQHTIYIYKIHIHLCTCITIDSFVYTLVTYNSLRGMCVICNSEVIVN